MSYDWLPIWMTLNLEIPIAHIISMGSESLAISNLISKVYTKRPYNFAFHSKYKLRIIHLLKNQQLLGMVLD